MPLVAPFGFYGQEAAAGPFDFVFVEKLTNIGSDGSVGPAGSTARNQDITYNSSEQKWYLIACGGSTDTYHYDYTYPGSKTGAYIGKADPRFSNRGITYNGTEYYVETYFQNLSGTKENPTGLAKYEQNTAGTGSFDLSGSAVLGPTPPQEYKSIDYDATNDIYALASENGNKIQFTDGFSNNSLFSMSTVIARPSGVAFSTTYSKLFILYRDLSSGDGQLDMYDYDFDNPNTPNPATRQSLILSGSDLGSSGGNVFRLAGVAVDNVNNNMIILHSNAGSGTTVNKSEGFVYSLNG